MTVANQTNRIAAVGNAAIGQEVPFSFPYAATSDITVYSRVTATGVPTDLAETTNYTLTAPSDTGGTLTTVTAVAATSEIHIIRNTPKTQALDLESGSSFSAENQEDAFDKAIKLIIENKDSLDRALRAPATDAVALDLELPSSVDRASKNLGFDASGNATVTDSSGTFATQTGVYNDFITKSPYVDVRAFGDGNTEVEVQAAVDSLTSGAIVILPSGTLTFSNALNANENDVTFTSFGLTTINVVGAISGFNVTGARNTIQNLAITGDNTVGSFGVNSSATNTVVKDCIISEFDTHIKFAAANCSAIDNTITQSAIITGAGSTYCIIVLNTTGAIIKGNRITNPTYAAGTDYPIGIYIGNLAASVEYNTVIGNHVYNGYDSISIRGPYSIVRGNICDSAYEAGILADGTIALSTSTTKCVINSNLLTDCGRWGIAITEDNDDISITGNTLYNCGTLAVGGDSGIYIGSGDYNHISRIAVSGNVVEGGKIGISILNNTGFALEHVSIVGNSVADCTSSGITVSRADNVSVIANSVNNCTTYGIRLPSNESDGIVIQSNILTDNGTDLSIVAGAGVIVGENVGSDETITADGTTLHHWGSSELDSTSNKVDSTLPGGEYIGQIKTIVMTEASNSSTVSITNHQTSDPEVATFDAVDETGVFMWTGTEWITMFATCTFV